MSKRLIIPSILVLCSLGLTAVVPNFEKKVDSEACNRWVDSVYNTLTPRERVAQLIFPKFIPFYGERSRDQLKSLVDVNHVGGLLFAEGTLEEYVEMTNYAQSLSKVPLLMVFDGEWGLAMRVSDTPRFPRNMALGAVNDTNLMYRYGREMARESRAMGIHVNFAPVLDVNTNPLNPVIGDRAFGSDPEMVSRLGVAYSRGLEDGGMQAVAKHFPGHGDTDSDSHKTLPTVNYSLEHLDSTHILPFRDFIDAGLSGVMTAHLTMPQLDATLTPASLSYPITTGILKDKLGFEGLVYTDALGMRGAKIEGRSNAVMAIEAGADVLEASSSPVTDIDNILKAIEAGQLSWETIENRCKRILKYKYILGLPDEKPITLEGLKELLNSPEAISLNRELSNKSVTLVKNENNALPIGNLDKNKIAVVKIGKGKRDRANAGKFFDMAANYAPVDTYEAVTDDNLAEILAHDVVVALVLWDDQEAVADARKLTDAKSLITAFMLDPFKIERFKPAVKKSDAVLLTYDDTPMLQEAAAQALFGGIDITGKLPVPLNGIAPFGAGIELKKSRLGFSDPLSEGLKASLENNVDSIVNHGIAVGAFPGAQLLIAKNGNVVVNKAYGNITAGGEPVTNETVYDLASVSKALGTLPSVMKVYDLGLFEISDSASKYIPGLRNSPKETITIRDLLYHESGMPASLNMFDVVGTPEHHSFGDFELRRDITSPVATEELDIEADKGLYVGKMTYDTIMSRIYTIPLRNDKSYNYSCLNFCLLMDLNQRVTGVDHRTFSRDSIFAPLGAFTTGYRPTEYKPLTLIPPTELDTIFRDQLVWGYVHDELSNFSGGVQGNAGLFSNALDLAKICQMWLNGGTYGDKRILSPETVELFTTSKSPTSRRGLGFDKPDKEHPEDSPTCEEADASVFGHTGFTGTIFWVDPKNDVIFVFLCNRVNPTRNNRAFSTANTRPALFREVYNSMENNE